MWVREITLEYMILIESYLFWTIASVKGTDDYNYKHLQLATNNFSEENIIGKGGFGEVFKVIILVKIIFEWIMKSMIYSKTTMIIKLNI